MDETLEFGIDIFRDYSAHSKEMLPELQSCVEQHTKLAVDTFNELWNANALDQITGVYSLLTLWTNGCKILEHDGWGKNRLRV